MSAMAGRERSAEWLKYAERGSPLLLRFMGALSLRFGRRCSRLMLYPIAAYFFLFAPTAARHARRYLARALGRAPTARDRFRQLLYFGTTIHDRVYLMNRRVGLFEISIDGEPLMRELLARGQGAFLMAAHMGSIEVISSLARTHTLRIAMAAYPDNARRMHAVLSALSADGAPEIIPLGQLPAMLRLRERLDEGAFVGLMGDRTLGDEPVQRIALLGTPAPFPVGPMRVAAMLRRPVILMLGLYRGGNRYHIVFEQLADFTHTDDAQRAAAIAAAQRRYAALLERYCRSDPYNWFNFFDFWREHG